jgi:hypothetical protein
MKRWMMPLILLALCFNMGCRKEKMTVFPASDPRMAWHGRTWVDNTGLRYLIGSASSLRCMFYGDRCRVWMQNAAPGEDYNYISIVIDGVRQPRTALRLDSLSPVEVIPATPGPVHTLEVYKETEAVNGAVIISQIEADSLGTIPMSHKKRIEFIGNSITAGMSTDASGIPCDAGTWYDQHNAYDAYGPRVARALDMEYMISAFSGIGIYRNSHGDSPVMRDIYPSAFLSPNPNSPRWDFKLFTPDIVSICLGTNDFSGGDGPAPRAPFDPALFIPAYVDFIGTVHGHYPDAQIIITNTPMLNRQQNEILMDCLLKIKTQAEADITSLKPLYIFSFSNEYHGGCMGHPSVEEQGKMAEEMILFLKGIK